MDVEYQQPTTVQKAIEVFDCVRGWARCMYDGPVRTDPAMVPKMNGPGVEYNERKLLSNK